MVQQFHSWGKNPKELKSGTQTSVRQCSLQHYSQQPKGANNPNVYQQMDMDKPNVVCTYNDIQP